MVLLTHFNPLNKQDMKYNVGDKLVCINDKPDGEVPLVSGKHYEVKSTEIRSGKQLLQLSGVVGLYLAERFDLIPASPPADDKEYREWVEEVISNHCETIQFLQNHISDDAPLLSQQIEQKIKNYTRLIADIKNWVGLPDTVEKQKGGVK